MCCCERPDERDGVNAAYPASPDPRPVRAASGDQVRRSRDPAFVAITDAAFSEVAPAFSLIEKLRRIVDNSRGAGRRAAGPARGACVRSVRRGPGGAVVVSPLYLDTARLGLMS